MTTKTSPPAPTPHVHGPGCSHDHDHGRDALDSAQRSGAPSLDPTLLMGRQPHFRDSPRIGRNDPCHCGSGKKFKKCHGA